MTGFNSPYKNNERQADYKKINGVIEQVKLGEFMYELGCKQAFNLDGGQTTQLYWNDTVFNVPYDGGRSTSDIIYLIDPENIPG